DSPEQPKTALTERTEDQRLALVERESGRVSHHTPVRDEDGELGPRRNRPEKTTHAANLHPPGCVVLGVHRVQECSADRRAPEREARAVSRPATPPLAHAAATTASATRLNPIRGRTAMRPPTTSGIRSPARPAKSRAG